MAEKSGKPAKPQRTMGELWTKCVNTTKATEKDLTNCGPEKVSSIYRENRPLAQVPNWVMDNDFGGASTAPPNEDMDRLEKEIRTVVGELQRGKTAPDNEELNTIVSDFFKEMCKVPLPEVLLKQS